MKKPLTSSLGTALLVPLLSFFVAFPSLAQGPGGRPPRDDFGPRQGGMRGDGMRQGGMRRERGKMQLNRMWRGLGRLEGSKHPLSKAQAQKIVGLVIPWSKKPQMTDAQAQTLHQKLEVALTSAQKNDLDDGPPRDGRGGGQARPAGAPPRGERPPGGFGGGFDGPPRGGRGGDDRGRGRGDREGGRGDGEGGRGGGMRNMSDSDRQVMRTWMDNSNPFFAPTGTATWKNLPAAAQPRIARRYKESRATLEAISRKAKS